MTNRYRFTQSSGLNDSSRAQVIELIDRCNKFESLDIPIFPDHLESDRGAITAIHAWSGGNLVGFAAIPDDPHLESSLMVHPDHRRRAIGRQLIDAIRAEFNRRDSSDQLLITDQASASAKAFFATLAIPYEVSEYRLELDKNAIDRSRPRQDELVFRMANPQDAPALTRIFAAAFGDTASEAAFKIGQGFKETLRHYYVAELRGQPIGMSRAGAWDSQGDITAFAVLPEHQGRGYGRQILIDAIDLLLAQNLAGIFIEVETQNRNALGLYESCGFKVINEFGYYRLSPETRN